MIAILKKFWMEEEGGETVEWPLVIALVAIASLAAWTAVGTQVGVILGQIESAITLAE